MIIVRLSGGLGNQMFQYATGLVLATKNNTELKIDISSFNNPSYFEKSDQKRNYALGCFNLETKIATPEEIKKVKYPKGPSSKIKHLINRKIFRKFYPDYHPEFLRMVGDKIKQGEDIYLDGFFQSQKNFESSDGENYAEKIRQAFSFKKEILDEKTIDFENQIHKTNSISIHVRRGDYVENPQTNKYHGTCSIDYYQKAIEYFEKMEPKIESPHFFIFSDDPKWVDKNLKIKFNNTIVSGNGQSSEQELYLMTKCKHSIIANSSFSWWGAWLNQNPNKIIVAPKNWTKRKPETHPNVIPRNWNKV